MADEPAPAFKFDGAWPFLGTPEVNGHPLTTVTSFDVHVSADNIPVIHLTLVGPGALELILSAARVQVSDETREALQSLGWTPPSQH